MVISTLTGKNQTTLGMEFVKLLGLEPGTRLKQSLEGNRIIIEPLQDMMSAFGSLADSEPGTSIKEETAGMEAAIGKAIAAKAGL